jgi:hypothetical protein
MSNRAGHGHETRANDNRTLLPHLGHFSNAPPQLIFSKTPSGANGDASRGTWGHVCPSHPRRGLLRLLRKSIARSSI